MKRRNLPIVISSFLLIVCLGFFLANRNSGKDKELPVEALEEEKENIQEAQMERYEHEVRMTKDPALGYVPVERLIDAEAKTKQIMADYFRENSPQSLMNWVERGPNNIGGRARALIIDRNDVTNNTVLVGSVSGGLWRTTNFKSATPTWTRITSVSANLAITAMAQDPSNFNVMYAGTGEGFNNADAVRGLGVYKSTDAGLTWNFLASTTTSGASVQHFRYVQDLAVYTNGDVYAATKGSGCNFGGILKSSNGGSSWTWVIGDYNGSGFCSGANNTIGSDLEISASGDIYATTQSYSSTFGKIWKSPAGGSVGNVGTWLDITPGNSPGDVYQRIDVGCAASDNNKLYAVLQNSGNGIDSIVRSDNGGTSWVNADVTTNWCDQGSSTSLDFSRGQAWYDLIIAVKPDDPAVVYAGGVDVMKSINSGGAWAQITQWNINCGTLPNIHADIHNIVFMPGSPNEFIVLNDGGIYYSTDGGTTFSSKSAGFNTIQYYGHDIHPTAGSNYILAGAQDNGTHKFSAAGLGSITTATGGDGVFCAINQLNANIQVASVPGNFYSVSTNGGASFGGFLGVSNSGRFVNPWELDPTGNFIYAAAQARNLFRFNNVGTGGLTVNTESNVASTANHMISAVKIDPNTPNRVWMAFSNAGSTNVVPEIYYSDGSNDFSTNTITAVTSPTAVSGAYVSSIDIEQGNANHILVTLSNYGVTSVYESTNLGASWTAVEGNLPDMPVRWGVFIPAGFNPGSGTNAIGGVLLATELGVWSTPALNGGATVWTQNSTNMGNVRTDMIKIRASDKLVSVATHGRGMFTAALLLGGLPVNFTSFTGKAEEKQNMLNWKVENEVNNKGYEIERKYKNQSTFTKIGFVAAKSANAAANEYQFPDALVDLGIDNVSYRLKQIDLDGKSKYSPIVNLTRKVSPRFVEYISARTNSLLIRLIGSSNQQLTLRVFDANGRLLQQKQIAHQTQEVSLAGLPHGVFVVELSHPDGRRHTQRIVY